ncbi:Zinc carboxypeptidase [Bacillus cereus AH1272]|nr:Zinc carboxypeptidase [Bacillus cereus AH1272]EEL94936.1 Zinc carboxypeptidase [Bacillus cereus AH1273]
MSFINKIRNAVYGKDVRKSIADGIEAINKETESVSKLANKTDKRVDNLILNAGGDSNEEVVDARGKFELLGRRLDDVDKKIEVAELVTGAASEHWKPPVQPDCSSDSPLFPPDRDPEKFITNMYDPLVKADPGYVRKELMGKDQSGQHNIYKFIFEPKNPVKEVIVAAGTHGNEFTSEFVVPLLLGHIVKDWAKHPQLAYIRHNVRIIVLPMINPWGFRNFRRQNSRGVDLNRNSSYLWDEYTSIKGKPGGEYYKGEAPFSEVEARYVRDTINQHKDAFAFLDLHTIITVEAEFIIFTPRHKNSLYSIFTNVIRSMYKQDDRIVWGTSAVPTFSNFAANEHGMLAANPEWKNLLRGKKERDSVEMTTALEWYGNIIIQACAMKKKPNGFVGDEPFTKRLVYKNNGLNPVVYSKKYEDRVPHTYFNFPILRQGIATLGGSITVSTKETLTLTLNPLIYQKFHRDNSYDKMLAGRYFESIHTLGPGTHTIPLDGEILAFPSNYNVTHDGTKRTEYIGIQVRASVSNGSITLEGYRAAVRFESSDSGDAVARYDGTGKEHIPDEEAYEKVYPLPKFELDDEEISE